MFVFIIITSGYVRNKHYQEITDCEQERCHHNLIFPSVTFLIVFDSYL